MSGDEFVLVSSTGQRIALKSYQLLGRDAACDILLAAGQPSRRHAEIRLEQGRVTLNDLGSTNGSYVNEKLIEANAPIALTSGDTLRFDANNFVLEAIINTDATVMRPVPPVDINATVMRAVPVAEKPAPAVEKHVTDVPTKPAAPQSWAMGGQQAVAGTQLLSGTQLEGIRASLNASVAAQEVDAPTLILANGKQYRLSATTGSGKWEIGRAATCDIIIEDGSVSTNHAQIINDGNRWKLIDLMSANGTYVNGEKGLTTYLSGGDQIRFGTVDAVFQLGGVSQVKPQVTKSASNAAKSGNLVIGAIAFVATLAVLAGVLFFIRHQ